MRRASTREAGILLDLLDRIPPSDAEQQNDLGVVLHRRGLTTSAIEAFAGAVVLDPTLEVARRNLARALTDPDGRHSRLESWRAQAASDPDAAAPWVALARLAFARRSADELATAMREVTRVGAMDHGLAWLEVAAAIDAGRLDDAGHALAARGTEDPAAWRWQALLAYRRGDLRAARDLVEVAVSRASSDAEVHLLRAFILGDLGDSVAARQAYQAAVLLRPGLARAEPHLALDGGRTAMPQPPAEAVVGGAAVGTRAVARRAVGVAAVAMGYTDVAARALEAAFAVAPDVRGATALATIAMRRGDLGAAFGWFDRLVAEQPDDATLWNARGVAAHRLGRSPEAEASYRRAAQLAPDDPIVLGNLAVALLEQGRRAEALPLARRAAAGGPRVVRRQAAGVLAACGEMADARATLTALLADGASPDEMAWLWYAVARLALAAGAVDAARDAAERATLADASFAVAWHLLAAAHEAAGDPLAAALASDRGLAASAVVTAPPHAPVTHEAVAGRGGA